MEIEEMWNGGEWELVDGLVLLLSLEEGKFRFVPPFGVVRESRVLLPDLETFKVSGSVRYDSGSARGDW